MQRIPTATGIQELNIGYFTQSMSSSDVIISAADSQNNWFRFTGTSSLLPTVTISRAPNAGTIAFIENTDAGGGFFLKWSTGVSVVILGGSNYIVYADGTDMLSIALSIPA